MVSSLANGLIIKAKYLLLKEQYLAFMLGDILILLLETALGKTLTMSSHKRGG